MASADFWSLICSSLGEHSLLSANNQISPGNAHTPSRVCPPHLRPHLLYRYWALMICAISPGASASCDFCSSDPRFAFRFHLAVDTLAVRLLLPPACARQGIGCREDFHLQECAPHLCPCRGAGCTTKKRGPLRNLPCIPKLIHIEPLKFERVVLIYKQHNLLTDGKNTLQEDL